MNSYIDSGEQCDDGNSINGDGCDRDWQKESGFIWDNNKMPSFWFPACGDGYRNGTEGEEWDDRNNVNYDGWSSICKVEPNYACSNATGVDICKTIYQAPKIISKGLVLEKLKISIEFDEIMMKQELTNFDLRLDIYGVNAPYYVTWNANFDQNKLIIDFVCSPVLIGGSIETINLILIDTKKFKSLHEIPLISSQEFIQ